MYGLVSIIVPVYNVEKYIEECIRSIIEQTYSNIEILLINDGSIDNSYDICKKLLMNDKRIRLFNQENSGVSRSRNVGLQNAKGKYICFVDSDDYVTRDFIEQLVNPMNKYGISICGYNRIENGMIKKEYVTKCNNIDDLYKKIFAEYTIHTGCCNKCFHSEIIKKYNLVFDETISVGEDMVFLARYLNYVNNNYIYIERALYNYRKNEESALQKTYTNKKLDKKKATCFKAIDELFKIDVEKKLKKYFSYRAVKGSLWFLLQMIYAEYQDDKYYHRVKQNIRKHFFEYRRCKAGGISEQTMAFLTFFSPKLVYYIGYIVVNWFPKFLQKKLE